MFLISGSVQWCTNWLDGWMFEVKLSMSLFSYPEEASLSEGLDVSGNLLRFFWLNSGTDRQPVQKWNMKAVNVILMLLGR